MADLSEIVAAFATEKGRDLGAAFVAHAQQNASRRTGTLADSIEAEDPVDEGGVVTVRVFVGAEYAEWNNTGTGIYGPTGQPIVAQHTLDNGQPGFLRFDSPILGIVYVRQVDGSEGSHFWDRTKEEWGSIVSEAAA